MGAPAEPGEPPGEPMDTLIRAARSRCFCSIWSIMLRLLGLGDSGSRGVIVRPAFVGVLRRAGPFLIWSSRFIPPPAGGLGRPPGLDGEIGRKLERGFNLWPWISDSNAVRGGMASRDYLGSANLALWSPVRGKATVVQR